MLKKYAKVLSMMLVMAVVLTVAGCGGGGGGGVVSNDGGETDIVSTITGLATTLTSNLAPVRLGSGKVKRAGALDGANAYLGYFDSNGEFVNLTSDGVKLNDGRYTFTDQKIPINYRKNLIVRITYQDGDGAKTMENVIPYVKAGKTTAETVTPITSKKTVIVKAAAKQGKTTDINIAEVLTKIPPATLSKLDDKDIELITGAFIAVIEKEASLASTLGINDDSYVNLKDYAFQLSQDIMEGIEDGTYTDEDKAWKIYEYKLRTWALENGLEESDVDALLTAKNSEFGKIATDVADGSISIGEEEQTLIKAEDVKEAFNNMVNNVSIDSKTNFIINEVVRLRSRIKAAIEAFDATVSLTSFDEKLDKFVSTVKANDFSTPEEAEAYMDFSGFELEKMASIKIGEMFYAAKSDFGSLSTFITNVESISSSVDEAVKDLADDLEYEDIFGYHPEYENWVADSSNSNFEPSHELMWAIEEYMERAEGETAEKLAKVNGLLAAQKLAWEEAFESVYQNWDSAKISAMAGLMASLDALEIEKPLPLMERTGEPMELFGRLKQLNVNEYKTVKINDVEQTFKYKIVEPVSGQTIAYARLWTEADEEAMVDKLDVKYDGTESVAHYFDEDTSTYYDDYNSATVNDLIAEIEQNDGDPNDIWKIEMWEDGVWAQKISIETEGNHEPLNSNTVNSKLVNNEYEFSGLIFPPEGAYTGDVVNILAFETNPIFMAIGVARDQNNEYFENFSGRPVDGISAKVIFSETFKKYMVVHNAYGEEVNDTVITKPIAPVMDVEKYVDGVNGTDYIKPIYWFLDFNPARTWDDDAQIEVSWNPNDYTAEELLNPLRFFGEVKDIEEKDSAYHKRLTAYWVERPFYDGGTADFWITGVLGAGEAGTGTTDPYTAYPLFDMNGYGSVIAYVICPDTLSESNTWLSSNTDMPVTFGPVSPYFNEGSFWGVEIKVKPEMNNVNGDILATDSENEWARIENFSYAKPIDGNVITAVKLDSNTETRSEFVGKMTTATRQELQSFGPAFIATQNAPHDDRTNLQPIDPSTEYWLISYTMEDPAVVDAFSQTWDGLILEGVFAAKNSVGELTTGEKVYIVDLFGVERKTDGNPAIRLDFDGDGTYEKDFLSVNYNSYLRKLIAWVDWSVFRTPEMKVAEETDVPNTDLYLNDANEIIIRSHKGAVYNSDGIADGEAFEDRFQFEYHDWERKVYLSSVHHGLGTLNDYKEAWLMMPIFDFSKASELPTYIDSDNLPTTPAFTKSEYFGNGMYTFEAYPYMVNEATIGVLIIAKDPSDYKQFDLELMFDEPDGLFNVVYNKTGQDYTIMNSDFETGFMVKDFETQLNQNASTVFPEIFSSTTTDVTWTNVTYVGEEGTTSINEDYTSDAYYNTTKMGQGMLELKYYETSDSTTSQTIVDMDRLYFFMDSLAADSFVLGISGIEIRAGFGGSELLTTDYVTNSYTFDDLDPDSFEPVSINLVDSTWLPASVGEVVNYGGFSLPDGGYVSSSITKTDGGYVSMVEADGYEWDSNTQTDNYHQERYEIYWIVNDGVWTIDQIITRAKDDDGNDGSFEFNIVETFDKQ